MKDYYYGFTLAVFKVDISNEKVIVLGSQHGPVRQAALANAIKDPKSVEANLRRSAGAFTMEATCEEHVICSLPVETSWVRHPAIPGFILGLRSNEAHLIDTLRQYNGKPVTFKFRQRARALVRAEEVAFANI